jgi:hypothetical protein
MLEISKCKELRLPDGLDAAEIWVMDGRSAAHT